MKNRIKQLLDDADTLQMSRDDLVNLINDQLVEPSYTAGRADAKALTDLYFAGTNVKAPKDDNIYLPQHAQVLYDNFEINSESVNSAGWAFLESYRRVYGEEASPKIYNNIKSILNDTIKDYLDHLANTIDDTQR